MDIEHAIKELQETAVVMTHIQAQHAAMAKDHTQWLGRPFQGDRGNPRAATFHR